MKTFHVNTCFSFKIQNLHVNATQSENTHFFILLFHFYFFLWTNIKRNRHFSLSAMPFSSKVYIDKSRSVIYLQNRLGTESASSFLPPPPWTFQWVWFAMHLLSLTWKEFIFNNRPIKWSKRRAVRLRLRYAEHMLNVSAWRLVILSDERKRKRECARAIR